MNSQTYRPRHNYCGLEKIAYDYGYKEGQTCGVLWAEYVGPKLESLLEHFRSNTIAYHVACAYEMGHWHGSQLEVSLVRHIPTALVENFANRIWPGDDE